MLSIVYNRKQIKDVNKLIQLSLRVGGSRGAKPPQVGGLGGGSPPSRGKGGAAPFQDNYCVLYGNLLGLQPMPAQQCCCPPKKLKLQ
ncbi:MAG: hypothetical protein EZS28_005027 [Streblomastix strix]|uniref:Uncharacterized protein n=1 Tax=Streblomastix strix TaxID=222440 RepID=A0A5J4WWM9_9EUKA|nr:MAG: hypothetical protein EZS28_005027 [Streblomastix strix]